MAQDAILLLAQLPPPFLIALVDVINGIAGAVYKIAALIDGVFLFHSCLVFLNLIVVHSLPALRRAGCEKQAQEKKACKEKRVCCCFHDPFFVFLPGLRLMRG